MIPRVIPCLLLKNSGLVKTQAFRNPVYVGDPVNAVKIFNEKEVDELIFLDIMATIENRRPNFGLISDIASECFMPFGYGGGIRRLEDAEELFKIGVEKIILNSIAAEDPPFVRKVSDLYGSQSVVISIDVKRTLLRKYEVHTRGGRHNSKHDPVNYAKMMEEMGAGEIFLNSIDRDGTGTGFDLELIHNVSSRISIPLVACGGAGKIGDFREAIEKGGASAVSAGSMFVFHGKHRAVLITCPGRDELERLFA